MAARPVKESALHKAVAQYLAAVLLPDAVWTTVGHGGGGKVRGAQLKAMGLRPGWPDIQILYPMPYGMQFVGIELKAKGGVVSEAQKKTAEAITLAGGTVWVCRTIDEVKAVLVRHGLIWNPA